MAKPDFTNPRQILLEIHKSLRDYNPSKISNKDLERWKKKKGISDERWAHVYTTLNQEIIAGLAKLFPISSNDGINFHTNEGVHKYSGQLFSAIIFNHYHYSLIPFIRTWEIDYDLLACSTEKADLALQKYIDLLNDLVEFDYQYRNQLLLPEKAFSNHFGSYWYLPVYEYKSNETFRMVLPITRLLARFVDLKGYPSRDGLVKESVAHQEDEDIREGDYWQIEKSLDRLNKGEFISIAQLNKLRKIRFSKFIIDEHWQDKSEEEKTAHIQVIRKAYHSSAMSDEELENFNRSWRKMYEHQNKYFKDSVDAMYEAGLIITFLISRMILDLTKHFPDIGVQFAKLHP